MIFNNFYHPIAVQILQNQDLENVSLSGNLRSTVLMNPKRYHGKPSFVLCGTIPRRSAFADCLDNTLRNYDIPTGNLAVSCSVSFNIIVNILRRYPIAEFL